MYLFSLGIMMKCQQKKLIQQKLNLKIILRQYVSEARSKKATPVLLTPVARRKFDSTGKIDGTHDVYSQIVRDVAKKKMLL